MTNTTVEQIKNSSEILNNIINEYKKTFKDKESKFDIITNMSSLEVFLVGKIISMTKQKDIT